MDNGVADSNTVSVAYSKGTRVMVSLYVSRRVCVTEGRCRGKMEGFGG